MGQYIDKYMSVTENEDDALFKDMILDKSIIEANFILAQKDYYYQNKLIKEICDGECSNNCTHIVLVDTEDGLITEIYT
jgi:hypothetical protein